MEKISPAEGCGFVLGDLIPICNAAWNSSLDSCSSFVEKTKKSRFRISCSRMIGPMKLA